jgi:hypothetical protein
MIAEDGMTYMQFAWLGTALGVVLVLVIAGVLRLLPSFRRTGTGRLLAVSYGLSFAAFVVAAPLVVAQEWVFGSMAEGIYPPYCILPGMHIYFTTEYVLHQVLVRWIDLWLMETIGYTANKVLLHIVLPGLFGGLAGAAQWYALGRGWDRLRNRQRAEVAAPSPAA